MNQEMIIWTAIVVVLLVALAIKTIAELRSGSRKRLIEIASERELFFCPGDIRNESDGNI